MTKIFYPKPDSNKAKKVLKLNRGQLKTLIEPITGQNNLNYMNNKVYRSVQFGPLSEAVASRLPSV